MHIFNPYMFKLFFTPIINSNNCLYCNFIIYKLDILILKFQIQRLSLPFHYCYFKS